MVAAVSPPQAEAVGFWLSGQALLRVNTLLVAASRKGVEQLRFFNRLCNRKRRSAEPG